MLSVSGGNKEEKMKNNVILIGMPGVGKSTVGVILAKLIGYRFIDTDLVIQQHENRLLKDIINSEGIDGFLEAENSNVEEASALTEKYDIVKAPIAKKAIPECNIVCITGDEMKTSVGGYLKVLYDLNPKSVGENLPGDDFYYIE